MFTELDPDGQRDMQHGNPYGLKRYLLQQIKELKQGLAKVEQLLHAQPEIINDATRAVVLRELVGELHKSAGRLSYDAGYEEMVGRVDTANGLKAEAERLENWAKYLEEHGWVKKYLPDGTPKVRTLAEMIDEAYIRGGAEGVLTLMARPQ